MRAALGRNPGAGGRSFLRLGAMGWLTTVLALPLLAVVVQAFADGPGAFWRALARPVPARALWLTLWTALVMAVINAVMGTLTAWVLVRYRFPGRRAISAIVDLPLAIPTLTTGVMLVVLFGPQHALGAALAGHGVRLVFASPGIILALIFTTYPLVVRLVAPALAEVDRVEEEAALTLGATRLETFRRIVLPAVRPAIVSGVLLAFARAVGEFGSIVIVSGNIPRRTLTAAVHVFAEIEAGDTVAAAAMSTLLLLASFAIIALVGVPTAGAGEPPAGAQGPDAAARMEGARARAIRGGLIVLVVLYVALLIGAPSAAILAGAFSHGVFAFVRELVTRDALHAIFLTLVLTSVAVVVNGVMGLLVAYVLVRDRFPGRRLVVGLVDLPMAVSPVIAGYMLILLFGRIGWFGPLVARLGVKIVFALPAMAMATVFVTVPFVIREVMPVLAEAGLTEEQAAQTLGATPWQAFLRVTLPGLRAALSGGVMLTAARALGEFGAVLVVSGGLIGTTETATLYIFRALDERNDVGAYAVAVVLGAISVMLLLVLEARKRRQQQ